MRLRITFMGAAALMLIGVPGYAQDSDGAIEEIVVTARKFGAERLQDVPVTVTAFTQETLEAMQVLDFEDFAYQVPGLTFLDTGPGQRRYVMRGIQSAGQQQVAVYYDEVPLPGIQSSTSNSGSQTTDLKLFDMERIEALRGPQGTTFGANSQSGTMRFHHRQAGPGRIQRNAGRPVGADITLQRLQLERPRRGQSAAVRHDRNADGRLQRGGRRLAGEQSLPSGQPRGGPARSWRGNWLA